MSEATEIAALEAAFKENHQELKTWMEKAEGQIKESGEAQTEVKSALEALATKGEEVGQRIDKLEGRINMGGAAAERQKSVGETFVESDEFKSMQNGRGTVARLQTKAIVNATGQNQPLVGDDRVPGIIHEPNRRLTIRDLLPVGRTSSNLVQFTSENVFTNNAGPQIGSGSPTEYENVTKPESNITFTLSNAAVTTLAHFILASRQVLSDAPMLQSYIDGRLRYGLALEEEDQILNGTGVDNNLSGLVTNQTTYNRGATDDTYIDTLRKAITQCQLSEYQASAIVMNPADWETIELQKDSQNRYIFAQPQGIAGPRMWGLPVLPTNSMTAGTFLVGAFDMAAQIWDREDATVEVSREDNDNFRKNMVTILAEERLALTIYRTAGLVGGSF